MISEPASRRHGTTQDWSIRTSQSSEEIIDHLHTMKTQEHKSYVRTDYLQSIDGGASDAPIDEWCRFKMVQWCYSIIDFAKFNRETVAISMSYLDRFLSTNCSRSQQVVKDRKQYQLAAMTCLYLGIKIFEPKMIETSLMSDLSRGCYSPEDFRLMEIDILFALKWHVNDPTPVTYLMNYLSIIPTQHNGAEINREMIFDLARYQIELSVLDYGLMTESACSIAIAALVSSLNIISSNQPLEINPSDALASMHEVFKTELPSHKVDQMVQRLEDLYEKQIPIIVRRHSDNLSPTEINQVTTKRSQRRRSLSPNCVST